MTTEGGGGDSVEMVMVVCGLFRARLLAIGNLLSSAREEGIVGEL